MASLLRTKMLPELPNAMEEWGAGLGSCGSRGFADWGVIGHVSGSAPENYKKAWALDELGVTMESCSRPKETAVCLTLKIKKPRT